MEEGYLALRWNNHNHAFKNLLQILREQEIYTDVSLACEKRLFHVHKFVLSTCSESFKDIFSELNFKQHPVIYMKDVMAKDLECILDFMYKGEVHISRSELGSLLRTAESLRVKGLAVPDDNLDSEERSPSPAKTKLTRSHPSSTKTQKNSLTRSTKRSRPFDSSAKVKVNPRKRFKSENDPTLRNNNIHLQDTNPIDLSEIATVSPSFLTEDLDLLQIKKEIESGYENNLKENVHDEENDFDENEMYSGDEYGQCFKTENDYDHSNFSFENSEISTAALLQVDLNEDGERFFMGDASLIGSGQALISNTEEGAESQRKPFACSLCHNTFTRRDNLTNHFKTHLGERPYMCAYCKKCFTRKDYLKQHERIHTGEKPFQCLTCGRAFTRKEGLTDHMRCHSDLKEFACDICGKEFKQKCGLRFHKRNYHQ